MLSRGTTASLVTQEPHDSSGVHAITAATTLGKEATSEASLQCLPLQVSANEEDPAPLYQGAGHFLDLEDLAHTLHGMRQVGQPLRVGTNIAASGSTEEALAS